MNLIGSEVDFPKTKEINIFEQKDCRKFSILPEWRNKILKGLEGWEEKMVQIGVIDYLGLSVKLFEHLDKIEPCHSHILIDEVQDFGIVELKIIQYQ